MSAVTPADLIETRLEDGDIALSVLNYGAVTRGWWIGERPLILGYRDPASYLRCGNYLGAIAGRVANRIAGGRLVLDGQQFQLDRNEGPNHLHGGARGFPAQLWRMETYSAGRAVRLSHVSPDGEGGYPGRVAAEVTITLDGRRLTYDMRATVDRPTPINMAQHNYYALGGPMAEHRLTCIATGFMPVDAALLPTGEVRPVADGPLDFRAGRTLGAADPEGGGIDLNLVFPDPRDLREPVARLTAPDGLSVSFQSDQRGAQIYTARHLSAAGAAHDGQVIGPFGGVCFEPQGFPDAPNQPAFPSILVEPDRPYHQRLTLTLAGGPCG